MLKKNPAKKKVLKNKTMKKIIYTISIIFLVTIHTNLTFAQTKKNTSKNFKNQKEIVVGLKNEVLNDLLNICALNCENGNDVLNSFAQYKLNLPAGATNKDAAKSFLSAKNNEQTRDKIFIFFYGDKEFMKINFLTLGVKANNCELIAEFLVNNIGTIKERNEKFENN